MAAMPPQRGQGHDLDLHVRNFLDCMKSLQKPACDVAIAANTATVAHIGNIAFRTGRKLFWDGSKSQFIDDQKANEMMSRTYREPWKMPQV